MTEIDFVRDYLNPLLDENPGADLLPREGRSFTGTQEGTQNLLVSHTIEEGVDYLDRDDPFQVASRLVRVGLAELTARGASTGNCGLSLCFARSYNESRISSFARGLLEATSEFGIDISHVSARWYGSSLCKMQMDRSSRRGYALVFYPGKVAKSPMSACLARPGDFVCVSGPVGTGAMGRFFFRLKADIAREQESRGVEERNRVLHKFFPFFKAYQIDYFVETFLYPQPSWTLGSFLLEQAGGRAAVNVACGLIPDLERMALMSNVAIKLDRAAIPLVCRHTGVGSQIFDSPDHQLLFCIKEDVISKVKKWFPQVELIGKVIAGYGVYIVGSDGCVQEKYALAADKLEKNVFQEESRHDFCDGSV